METPNPIPTNEITDKARHVIASTFEVSPTSLQVEGVGGGYSRNRRSLVKVAETWLFAKEVDVDLLPDHGEEELWWLKKDQLLTERLRTLAPNLVPEYSELDETGHILTMPAYRSEEGWFWVPPEDSEQRRLYIDAVIAATRQLETVPFSEDDKEALKLQPHFRDHIALDDGLELIIREEAVRDALIEKYTVLAEHTEGTLHRQYQQMIQLLHDESALQELDTHAKQLIDQPNDYFGHCDVRSDNIAVQPETRAVKFVDWNWASYVTKGFGTTEFLTDMARRGTDVTPWRHELNPELLAATVGFYAKRCMHEPLAPGNTLRDMQTETAAVTYDLYKMSIEPNQKKS